MLTKSPILGIKNPLPVSIFILVLILGLSRNVYAQDNIAKEIYLPIGSLLIFIIGSLVVVKVNLKDKISYKDADERYKKAEVCDEIHKSVNEKLNCLPEIKETVTEIKTKIDILLQNGK